MVLRQYYPDLTAELTILLRNTQESQSLFRSSSGSVGSTMNINSQV